MACESLLKQVPIPTDQIKPILSQGQNLDAAAQHYARVIRSFVPGTIPRFDLVLLGMGPDGHAASLFPHSPALSATNDLVVATPVASLEPHVQRITFTAPLINAAAQVLFLVAGADKAQTLAAVLEGASEPERLPSQLIAPTDGELHWMIDHAAAQELQQKHG
jgi:6-phosphogluconolactonase